jgi:hypothetical protein
VAVSLFLVKYPLKLNDIQKVVVPLLKYLPVNQAKKVILDVLFDNAATRLINKYGEIIIADLIVVAEKNGNLAKTIDIAKRSGEVRWLEEGDLRSGWMHIVKKHITGEIVGGTKFPSSMDQNQIKDLVLQSIRDGSETISFDSKGRKTFMYDYIFPEGLNVKTVVGDNGYIVTSFPVY